MKIDLDELVLLASRDRDPLGVGPATTLALVARIRELEIAVGCGAGYIRGVGGRTEDQDAMRYARGLIDTAEKDVVVT